MTHAEDLRDYLDTATDVFIATRISDAVAPVTAQLSAAHANLKDREAEIIRLREVVQDLTEQLHQTPEVPVTTARFPGDPNPKVNGHIWWGAAIMMNGSPAPHETAAGTPLAIRRRYWTLAATPAAVVAPNGAMLAAVREDHAAGRLPLVSFRPELGAAAAGDWDARFDALIAELESYSQPTWVIMQHEPENGWKEVHGAGATQAQKDAWTAQNAPLWRQAQVRFRDRMNAYSAAHGGIKRLAFGSCLMTYTWDPVSKRNVQDWWAGDGVWDFMGADHYTEATQQVERPGGWAAFVRFCAEHDIPFAVPEWGLRREDPDAAQKMQTFYDDMLNGQHDCVALCYFDSTANSNGTGYTLTGALLTKFRQLMTDSRSVNLATLTSAP